MRQDRFHKIAMECVPMVGDPGAYRMQVVVIAGKFRAEHRAVCRMVKAMRKEWQAHDDSHRVKREKIAAEFYRNRVVACNYILEKLSARGK